MRHQLETNEVKSQKFLSSCKKSMNQLTATIFQHAKSAIKPTTQTLGYKEESKSTRLVTTEGQGSDMPAQQGQNV